MSNSNKKKNAGVSDKELEEMARKSSLGIVHHLLGDYISDEEMACFVIGQLSNMAISMTVVVECLKKLAVDKDMVEFLDKVSDALPNACLCIRESVLDKEKD